MGNNSRIENKGFTIYIVSFLFFIYACQLAATFLGGLGKISFFEIGSLTLPSLGLFIVICFLAIWKRSYYFLFLIFIILAFPAPIDDLFPSIPLTNIDDKTQVLFPFFTRIDLYLILGIALKSFKRPVGVKVINFTLILKLLLLFLLFVFVVNIFKSKDLWDFNLLLAYSFHIRYLILFLILLQLYDIKAYQKQLILGFTISLFFLYFEAQINTLMRGSERLLSGSLSLNTFANISAAIALYMIFLLKFRQINKLQGILTIGISLLIILGSQTRGAVLTLILSYFLVYLLSNHRRIVINFLKVSGGVFIVAAIYLYGSHKELVPERYSYQELSKMINIDLSKNSLTKIIDVKSSQETSSIKSRIDLFESSLNMASENPLAGVGAGRWNRYKNEYSTDEVIPKVLLDSHNDYLALIAQYGILLGIIMAWVVFFYPFFLFIKRDIKKYGALSYLFVINFAMGIAAISNAGFFKHQVSALLLLCLCITHNLYLEKGNG